MLYWKQQGQMMKAKRRIFNYSQWLGHDSSLGHSDKSTSNKKLLVWKYFKITSKRKVKCEKKKEVPDDCKIFFEEEKEWNIHQLSWGK